MSQSFVPYADAVEVVEPGEADTFAALAATMREIAQKNGDRQRRTTRPVHGKSYGLVRAKVAVGVERPEPDAGFRLGFPLLRAVHEAVAGLQPSPRRSAAGHRTPR